MSLCSAAEKAISIIRKLQRDPCQEGDNGRVCENEDGRGDARCDEYARQVHPLAERFDCSMLMPQTLCTIVGAPPGWSKR